MRRRLALARKARQVGGVLAFGALAACNAILGIEDRPARPIADGGANDGSPRPPDAAGDARADASSCGTAALDPGATRLFCDDFDTGGSSPAGRWDETSLEAGPIDFDSSDFVSAPRSLRVELVAGSGSRTSTITKAVPTTTQDVTVAFDFRLDGPASQDFGAIEYASVDLLPPPAGVTAHNIVLFQYSSADPAIAYQQTPQPAGGDVTSQLTPPLAIGRWQRIALRVTFGATAQAFVSIDGTPVASVPISRVTLTSVVVHLGVDTAEARTTATVHFDDVTVDEQ